ncbi:MAG TPA: hydrogenase small subunit [Nitrospirota bacterium]
MKKKDFETFSKQVGGVSRRDFLKYCSIMAVGMGLPMSVGAKIAEAVTNVAKRPPVIWLSAQECTGCTESLLRSTHPTLDHLILDLISLDYHETLSTPSGHLAEEARAQSIKENKGKFVLVVDGSIPVKDGGVYCMIGGKPVVEILKDTAKDAAAIIAIGSCASWGGIPSASPNPTGATPVHEIIKDKPVVNIPGCPPSPYNFLSTVLYFVTFNKLPELDNLGRPKFAYGRLIHENCERRPHFDAGRFAIEFGDDNHRKGYCLYKLGCKGPETFNNCPSILYGDTGSGSWPVGTGHPCFGCSEKGIGFNKPIFSLASLHMVTPPDTYPHVTEQRGTGATIAAVAVVAGAAGAAIAAGAKTYKKLDEEEKKEGPGKKG